MKRMLGFLAVCLAIAISAQAGDTVTSVNVVGFIKKTVDPNLNIVSTVFFSGSNTLVEILGTNGVANVDPTYADNVNMWNGTIWQNYFLCDGSIQGGALDHKWVIAGTDPLEIATNIVYPGVGFWVRNRSSSPNTYSMKGEIDLENEVTIPIAANKLNLLAYPYAADRAISLLTFTNGTANVDPTYADNIHLYSGGSWKTLFLCDGSVQEGALDHKWAVQGTDPLELATDVLKASQGFWFRSRSGSVQNWTEKRPYLNE